MTIRTQKPFTWSLPTSGGAPMRRFISALAKWAVASSMAAGCGAHHMAEPAPTPKATAGSAGSRIEGSAGRGPVGSGQQVRVEWRAARRAPAPAPAQRAVGAPTSQGLGVSVRRADGSQAARASSVTRAPLCGY